MYKVKNFVLKWSTPEWLVIIPNKEGTYSINGSSDRASQAHLIAATYGGMVVNYTECVQA